MKLKSPKAFKSHTTTAITTTAFKIDLIDAAIGMKVFTSQRRTPSTTKERTTESKGIGKLTSVNNTDHSAKQEVTLFNLVRRLLFF